MGNKLIKLIILILLVSFFFSSSVEAITVAENSAAINHSMVNYDKKIINQTFVFKKMAIIKILERYHSPLTDSADQFINVCFNYSLDCYLLPSIAGLESTFGQFIYPNSYNPFGWGRGYIIFKNWDEAIEVVGRSLKINYIDKGAQSIDQIGSIYSESPTWAIRVNWFIKQFEKEEEEIRLSFLKNKIEL